MVVTPLALALGTALFTLGAQCHGACAARFRLPFARVGELSYGIYGWIRAHANAWWGEPRRTSTQRDAFKLP
jgi:hypothetical protein